MSEHKATIVWSRDGAPFLDHRYSRGHRWVFDGGVEVPASASPSVVPPPRSVAAAVDPEEALIASLSSCHMLWFLDLAAKRGFLVESYRDEAKGILGKGADGKLAITHVTLRPDAAFGGEKRPAASEVDALHHEAHGRCFISNSVRSDVRIEPVRGG
jgi:organic hydroperoxide reductase OsmC/OhrA